MADRGDPSKVASRILRERALAILRDTRAKIDPSLLAAMKERLSPAAQPAMAPAKDPVPLKDGLFKRGYQQPQAEAIKTEPPPVDEADENGMVPVDKQKIAQIVLQYMKNREDKQQH